MKTLEDKYQLILEDNSEPKMHVNHSGTKRWYLNGKLHRLDGPAVVHSDGDKHWYVNGKRHRLEGPAIEWNGVYKIWYVDGYLHRLDGPAVEYADGVKEYWIDGRQYSYEDWKQEIELLKGVKQLGDLRSQ